MSKIKCTLSVNAGISIEWHNKRILIDVFPQENGTFSAITPEIWEKILITDAFKSPDMLLFTHCHADHFSKERTDQFLNIYPNTKIYLPDRYFDKQVRVNDGKCFACGEIQGMAIQLTHEGKMYEDYPHYGYLLTDKEKIVLITGDCAVANPQLIQKLSGYKPDIAILDFPWITTSKGREFLKDHLKPKYAIVNHIPVIEDDSMGYYEAFKLAEKKVQDIRILCLHQPFDSIEIDLNI